MIRNVIIPINLSKNNILESFRDKNEINCTLGIFKAEIGDIVYFYATSPLNKIILKAEVLDVDREAIKIKRAKDINTKIRLISILPEEKSDKLNFSLLLKHGINGIIKGPILLENNPKLRDYLDMIEKEV
ncbi:hypothetical protein [Clostridium sp.]|uniref:hypothetical protein n=1 Tax=Clostridium sp. TaxID=1506 RepID=UPI003F3B1B79